MDCDTHIFRIVMILFFKIHFFISRLFITIWKEFYRKCVFEINKEIRNYIYITGRTKCKSYIK